MSLLKEKNLFKFFLMFFFIFFVFFNLIFSFQKRISFLVYNNYNTYLVNWQGKIAFTFDELNISSCNPVKIENSYLANEFNELLPFISYCDEDKKIVYLIFQVPVLEPNKADKLVYYYDGQNKINLETNFTEISGSCFGSPKRCIVNITFSLPPLIYNYDKILFDFKIDKPGSSLNKVYLTVKVDKCNYNTYFDSGFTGFIENTTEILKNCINSRLSDKKPLIITLIFSNLVNYISISEVVSAIKRARLLFYYPTPYQWGLYYQDGKYYNYFYSLDVSNLNDGIIIEDNLGKVLKLDLNSSYFGVYLNDTMLLPNNISEVKNNLVFVKFENISNTLFNKKPLIINESTRVNIFNIEKHKNENFTNYFNIRSFDSWIRLFFKNNEYYKTEKVIELYNPGNISYSNVLLNLTINKEDFSCYYYYCNDLELFYNDSGVFKPLKYRLRSCNDTSCNFDVLIPYLAANSSFNIFSYSNSKYSFLNKSSDLNIGLKVYLPDYIISAIYDIDLPNRLSRNYFKFVFEIPLMNKIYYSYYIPSNIVNLNFDVLNSGYEEFNNSNDKILNDLLVYLNNGEGLLINFNKYVGYYDKNLFKKGSENWKTLLDVNKREIILEGNNAYLDNLLLAFAPIGFVNSSLLGDYNFNYYNLNLSFDLDNAESLGEYIKKSYVFLYNKANNSFYPLFQPAFYLANNSKGILLDTKNSKIGLTSYNLLWKDKIFYYFLGSYYPVTTRKGNGVFWKVFPALHSYTDDVVYNILNYLSFYKKISYLSFYLKNQDVLIIK